MSARSKAALSAGLSPLARGTHIVVNHFNDIPRFIPAGAGNTTGSRIRQITGAGNTGVGQIPNLNNPVYPRWRGEHHSPEPMRSPDRGLSPLARGTRDRPAPLRVRIRFIPAGAGNTNAWHGVPPTSTVYPRWRGEHAGFGVLNFQTRGLSPLARGTRCCPGLSEVWQRFIPAGAGNTAFLISPPRRSTVYPRWRGEHVIFIAALSCPIGLSPLARGTPSTCPLTTNNGRFIPAGAGNTFVRRSEKYDHSVYPRWRGEHHRWIYRDKFLNGLSPLARGTRRHHPDHHCRPRFIPAGAGNTLL